MQPHNKLTSALLFQIKKACTNLSTPQLRIKTESENVKELQTDSNRAGFHGLTKHRPVKRI